MGKFMDHACFIETTRFFWNQPESVPNKAVINSLPFKILHQIGLASQANSHILLLSSYQQQVHCSSVCLWWWTAVSMFHRTGIVITYCNYVHNLCNLLSDIQITDIPYNRMAGRGKNYLTLILMLQFCSKYCKIFVLKGQWQ